MLLRPTFYAASIFQHDFLSQIAWPHQLQKGPEQLSPQGQHFPKEVSFHLVFGSSLLRRVGQPIFQFRQSFPHALHLEFHRGFRHHDTASLLRENARLLSTQPMFSPRGHFCLRQFHAKPLQFATSA